MGPTATKVFDLFRNSQLWLDDVHTLNLGEQGKG